MYMYKCTIEAEGARQFELLVCMDVLIDLISDEHDGLSHAITAVDGNHLYFIYRIHLNSNVLILLLYVFINVL